MCLLYYSAFVSIVYYEYEGPGLTRFNICPDTFLLPFSILVLVVLIVLNILVLVILILVIALSPGIQDRLVELDSISILQSNNVVVDRNFRSLEVTGVVTGTVIEDVPIVILVVLVIRIPGVQDWIVKLNSVAILQLDNIVIDGDFWGLEEAIGAIVDNIATTIHIPVVQDRLVELECITVLELDNVVVNGDFWGLQRAGVVAGAIVDDIAAGWVGRGEARCRGTDQEGLEGDGVDRRHCIG